jgi:hypothetical protein
MTVKVADEIGGAEAELIAEGLHCLRGASYTGGPKRVGLGQGAVKLLRWPGCSCSCTRPATAAQRRDSEAPSGLRPLPHPWGKPNPPTPGGILRWVGLFGLPALALSR